MRHSKIVLGVIALLALIIASFAVVQTASAKPGNGQETCASGDGWEKYDGLSGHSFTYPGEVPEGATVENCVKYSTTVVYGSGTTVFSDGKHEISHASFKVIVPDDPTDEPTDPTDEPTDPTDEPTDPTDEPTDPTDEPTDPTDEPTDEPTCGEPGYTPIGDECEEEEPTPDDCKGRPVIGGPCAPDEGTPDTVCETEPWQCNHNDPTKLDKSNGKPADKKDQPAPEPAGLPNTGA